MNRNSLLIILALLAFSVAIAAQDKATDDQYAIKVRPLLQPCEELKEADDATIVKAGKDIATADSAEKIRLAGELGKTCNKKSTEPLLPLLQEKDPFVRIAAIEALAHLGNEEAIEPLVELAKDPDWRVRFALGPALCAFQKQKSSYAALNYLGVASSAFPLDESDVRARCITFLALEQMRDVSFSRKPLFFLFGLQESKDEGVKNIARETLQAFKETRNGTRELIALLKQSLNPNYRRNCAYWLGQIKAEIGRDILTDVAANDSDANVKKIAAEALKLLGPGAADDSSPKATATPKTKATAVPGKVSNVTKPKPKSLTKAPAKK